MCQLDRWRPRAGPTPRRHSPGTYLDEDLNLSTNFVTNNAIVTGKVAALEARSLRIPQDILPVSRGVGFGGIHPLDPGPNDIAVAIC